jgi:tRNA (guanine-N7-)-methyltransferase
MPESPKANADSRARNRPIRSFVIRSGRMTEAQRKALDTHMRRWALPQDRQPENYETVFGNPNPLTLEIGFGMGDSLATMALESPQRNFIGVEVHQAGVGRLLALADEFQLSNLRVYCHDAVEVLQQNISHHSLERVNIYFPDPWHKTKHHKRRLIQPEFLTLLHSRLKNKGLLHIATDWEPYAKHVITVINQHAGFNNIAGSKIYTDPAGLGRPETKFERRGVKLGHGVWDMAFQTCHNAEERSS